MRRPEQQGYVLYTVVIMLVIVAATAFLVRNDSSFEAGVSERDLELASVDYVAEAAVQHALWQKDNYGCVGDYTIPATAFGPHTYTATIDSTATSSSRNLTAARDSWISEAAGDANHGKDGRLAVRNAAGDSFRSLLFFDLSAMGARYRVQSAIAWFYVDTNDDLGTVDIHAVTADWEEDGATWNNIASSFDAATMGSIPLQTSGKVWVSVDLTALAQQWANDPASNFGIMLIAASNDKESRYASREEGSGHEPYLEITTSVGNISPVRIEAKASLANGISRSRVLNDVPVYKTAVTGVLQNDSVTGVDATISDATPTTNYGTDKDIWISSEPDNARVGLLKFDLRDIPTDVRVINATLSLKRGGGAMPEGTKPGAMVNVYQVHSPWDEAFVSWNQRDDGLSWKNHGGDYSSVIEASTTIAHPMPERIEWEVTGLVEGWLNGDFPNYGLMLRMSDSDVASVKLDSSDHGDKKRAPSLTIEYACECGSVCMAPRGSGRVLLVIGDDPNNPSTGDAALAERFETWGYAVSLIHDEDTIANFDASVETNDAVFISPSVDLASLGSKLTKTFIGVVNASGDLNGELGFASGAAWPVGRAIEVIDVDHYITSVFPLGTVTVNRGSMEGLTGSGTEAPGAQRLAEWGSEGALLAIDAGEQFWKGGSAVGKRVMVPLGREGNVHTNFWTNSGSLMVQRALAWAADADVVGRRLLMVVDNSASLSVEDVAERNLLQSWGYIVRLISSDAVQGDFDNAVLINDVVFVSERAKANQVGGKLADTNIGVVLAQTELVDKFGIADGVVLDSGTDLVLDNSYYVTSPLPNGAVTVLSSANVLATLTGTIAAGIQIMGEASDESALVTLDTGAQTINGTAAGRRILLPWSGGGFDVNDLTDSGREIFERAVHWAADASGTTTSIYILSTDRDAELAGLKYSEEDLAAFTPWNQTSSLFFDGAAVLDDGKIDALHVLAGGRLLLSTKGNGDLGGLTFTDGDLVRYDIATDEAVLVLDGAMLFADDKSKISAVHLLPNGNLILATDRNATLGGLSFTDRDLVEYNRKTDTATLFFDGSSTTLNNKITGVHVLGNGHLVLSTKGATTLGGLSFDASDIIDYDPITDTAQLIFDGSELFKDADEKVNSVHIGRGSGSIAALAGGSCDGTFRDEFNSVSFAGNDGSLEWAADWIEVGESDGASAGDVKVDDDNGNYQLLTKDSDNGGEGVMRELDLSGAASAMLTYLYRRDVKGSNDYTRVEVRDADAGAVWTEIARHQGPASDKNYESASFDISAHISSRTQVRFITAPTMGHNEEVWFDDIEVLCSP